MRDFWKSAGFSLLKSDPEGKLAVTADFVRAYFTRPEIHPIDESGPQEVALFEALMADPFMAVGDPQLEAIEDPDTRDNYRVVLRFRDLLVWYHLAWTGESLRRDFPMLRGMLHKAEGFSEEDARQLLALIGDVLAQLIPRYGKLCASGKIELSLTPHAHPILPLLIDLASARESRPEVTLPGCRYPGGDERCRWHLERALELHEKHFGVRPRGCWPSEGGLSEAVLPLLREYGFEWTATGTNVLRNSIGQAAEHAHFQKWHRTTASGSIACFFRDDELSDRIGFQYSQWGAEDAVNDLVARLERIRNDWRGEDEPVVSIIMDGENAWEHFPYNGWFFLQHLYSKLALHPDIELTTISGVLDHGLFVGLATDVLVGEADGTVRRLRAA